MQKKKEKNWAVPYRCLLSISSEFACEEICFQLSVADAVQTMSRQACTSSVLMFLLAALFLTGEASQVFTLRAGNELNIGSLVAFLLPRRVDQAKVF